MAFMNLLQANFTGSLGNLTGHKWKNKSIVQTKIQHRAPNSPAQEKAMKAYYSSARVLFNLWERLKYLKPKVPRREFTVHQLIHRNKEFIADKPHYEGRGFSFGTYDWNGQIESITYLKPVKIIEIQYIWTRKIGEEYIPSIRVSIFNEEGYFWGTQTYKATAGENYFEWHTETPPPENALWIVEPFNEENPNIWMNFEFGLVIFAE